MSDLIFSVTSGIAHGQCPKCNEPFLGKFDSDSDFNNRNILKAECVNCHYKHIYEWTWPDDLPVLRVKKVIKETKAWKIGMKK